MVSRLKGTGRYDLVPVGAAASFRHVAAAGMVSVLVVAWVDRATGGDVGFLALYAVPVVLTSLSSGIGAGLGSAFLATAAWALARWPPGEPAALVAWNVLNRGVLFVTLALLSALYRRESLSAREDPLTGLPNRRAIVESLRDALETLGGGRGSVAVAMLDLDRFKEINDSDGHDAGDEALRAVAAVLRQGIRPGDLAGRLAGDEFVLLFRRVSAGQAEALVDRLLEGIRREGEASLGRPLSASAGLVLVEAPPPPVEHVLGMADEALLEAKALGRGRLVTRLASRGPAPEAG